MNFRIEKVWKFESSSFYKNSVNEQKARAVHETAYTDIGL